MTSRTDSERLVDILDRIGRIEFAGMRNILTHEYFRADGKIVRATIDKPLQELKQVCESEGQNS